MHGSLEFIHLLTQVEEPFLLTCNSGGAGALVEVIRRLDWFRAGGTSGGVFGVVTVDSASNGNDIVGVFEESGPMLPFPIVCSASRFPIYLPHGGFIPTEFFT